MVKNNRSRLQRCERRKKPLKMSSCFLLSWGSCLRPPTTAPGAPRGRSGPTWEPQSRQVFGLLASTLPSLTRQVWPAVRPRAAIGLLHSIPLPRVNSTLGLLSPSHAIVEAASTASSAGVTTPPGTGGASRGAWLDRCLAGVPPQPPCHSHTTQSLSRTDHVPPRGFSTLPRYASSRFNSRSVATLTRYCGGGQ